MILNKFDPRPYLMFVALTLPFINPYSSQAGAKNYYTVVQSNPGKNQITMYDLSKGGPKSFGPGDVIQFIGGETYEGNICLRGSGISGNPITLTTVGSGVATIKGRDESCIADSDWLDSAEVTLIDESYVTILNLNFEGIGSKTGVQAWAVRSNITGITLDDLTVTGHLHSGISVVTDQGGAHTAKNISISGTTSSSNGQGSDCGAYFGCNGIQLVGGSEYNKTILNSSISNVTVEHNGNSGIFLGSVDSVVVSGHSVASYNGNKFGSNGGGGTGMETSDSNNVLIEGCEASFNISSRNADGDGFDFDHGTTNSTLSNSYSHDNQGAGLLNYTYEAWTGEPFNSGNKVLANTFVNNATKNHHYAEIDLWLGGGNPKNKLDATVVGNHTQNPDDLISYTITNSNKGVWNVATK
jgi:hypothetical protein